MREKSPPAETSSNGILALVTGGAGFIGSHLVELLMRKGFSVRVLDNLSTGKLENIREHLNDPQFKFVKGDIRDRQSIERALDEVKVVFHLAAITSVPYSVRYPDITRRVNADGTLNILEACLRGNVDVERFVYISSCAVYGDPEYLPIDERHPTRPLSPYAESKLEAEKLCMEFRDRYGLKTTILRPFNVYGSRMRKDQYGGVIASFIERLRHGEPPIIYGDGEQTRDFVHVLDATSAMVLATNRREAVGEVINVGSGVPTSINTIARIIIELFGLGNIKPKYEGMRIGDIRHSCADITKARTLLGYEPKVALSNGLSGLIECL
jgi:nucleoside-diphosphate-sugar epimerase